jgi:phosphoenolpyruvate carboxykinase (GTP)
VPNDADLDLKGLDLSPAQVREALAVRPEEWTAELESTAEFFEKIGPTMPKELMERRKKILAALNAGPSEGRIAAAVR